MTEDIQTGKPRILRYLPLIVIICVAVVGAVTLRDHVSFETLRANREGLLAFRDQNLALMAVLFALGYIAIVAFSLPGGAVASVTGGFLFGLAGGGVLNVMSATIGAGVIFWAARLGLGASLAARIDAADGTVKTLKTRLHENEVSVLLLLRLVPAVPFFIANLLPALVGVGFVNFLWTTALGIIPGALVFTSIGVGLGGVFDKGDSPDLSLLWEPYVIGPILALCVLAALPIALRALRGKTGV